MPAPKKASKAEPPPEDPVEVFCRLRPVASGEEDVCCRPIDDTTVTMVPEEMHYKFTRVMDGNSSQEMVFKHVATPLVEDLISAKNGLLFTYGITGSGKTYTMSGSSEDPGLLPRSLDIIFNSIRGHQAQKYTFRPDPSSNGFEIQGDADRMLQRQKDVLQQSTNPADNKKRYLDREKDSGTVPGVDKDLCYSVFVSFVEVYKDSVYDLLEDSTFNRLPNPKTIREDRSGMMFVHGRKEVEVMDTEDAFTVLREGHKRRKVAHTTLNAESSRSHSVFTVRLVSTPVYGDATDSSEDLSAVTVSQLSLVDLAGSERTNRTGNTGDRLKEGSQINNSLMTLRTCINALRENQKCPKDRPSSQVPFRNSKITFLFKSYFCGRGKVTMVVCVNPQRAEYRETVHVMNFAEAAQEVRVQRAPPTPREVPAHSRYYTPGRHRNPPRGTPSNLLKDLDALSATSVARLPSFELVDAHDSQTLPNFVKSIEEWRQSHLLRTRSTAVKCDAFRKRLLAMVKEKDEAKAETVRQKRKIEELEGLLKDRDDMACRMEKRLKVVEREKDGLKVAAFAVPRPPAPAPPQSDLPTPSTSGSDLSSCAAPPPRGTRPVASEYIRAVSAARSAPTQTPGRGGAGEGASHTPRTPVGTPRYAQSTKSSRHMATTEGLRATARPVTRAAAAASTPASATPSRTVQNLRPRAKSPPPVLAKPNPRILRSHHRRSRSAGAASEKWLDHKPVGSMDLVYKPRSADTILQPNMKKKKSVTKLNVKDTKESSKYMLTHQQVDRKGNIRTDLIKGSVLPTAGGGSSVVFTGVETLKDRSPGTGNKQPYVGLKPEDFDGDWTDTENRCKVAIEGHGQLKRIDAIAPN